MGNIRIQDFSPFQFQGFYLMDISDKFIEFFCKRFLFMILLLIPDVFPDSNKFRRTYAFGLNCLFFKSYSNN